MSLADLTRTLARLAEVPEAAVRAACQEVEQIAAQEGGTITAGKKGKVYPLKAVAYVSGSGSKVRAVVWGTPYSFWVWKTTGTESHLIPTRAPTAKRPRPMYAAGYDHPVQRKQIVHPGIRRPARAWDRVKRRADGVVSRTVAKHVHRAVTGG